MKISICGKGGSGKSALTALLAMGALEKKRRVLVVDSDESNSGLFRALGFEKPPVPLMEMTGGKAKLKKKMSQNSVLNAPVIRTADIPVRLLLVDKSASDLLQIRRAFGKAGIQYDQNFHGLFSNRHTDMGDARIKV